MGICANSATLMTWERWPSDCCLASSLVRVLRESCSRKNCLMEYQRSAFQLWKRSRRVGSSMFSLVLEKRGWSPKLWRSERLAINFSGSLMW